MANKSFRSMHEVQEGLNDVIRQALQMTYNDMLDALHDFMVKDIYASNTIVHYDNPSAEDESQRNVADATQTPKVYQRSEWLYDTNPYTAKVYKVGDTYYGNFVLDKRARAVPRTEYEFGVGDSWKLDMEDFLDIMAGNVKQGLGMNTRVQRRSYQDDFMDWAFNKGNAQKIYRQHVSDIIQSSRGIYASALGNTTYEQMSTRKQLGTLH